MAEIGLAAAMYGKGEGNSVKHYYDRNKQSSKKGSDMGCKTTKPGKK